MQKERVGVAIPRKEREKLELEFFKSRGGVFSICQATEIFTRKMQGGSHIINHQKTKRPLLF